MCPGQACQVTYYFEIFDSEIDCDDLQWGLPKCRAGYYTYVRVGARRGVPLWSIPVFEVWR
jgi:hypothetical protein